ncbi:uncharacterized protein LOC133723167 [Rosa rugosa]|uniref:uncharacterized protein LOC133723167 n=1 Tax=Rosa rugosa TaxID=74645 RepID=UPI002B40F155|nr:uncharacterized protein LOC133723167 [Rosa rugosa]
MTVRDYEAEFSRMYRFVRPWDTERLAMHFLRGLNENLRVTVASFELATVAQMAAKAMVLEEANPPRQNDQAAARDFRDKGKRVAGSSSSMRHQGGSWKKHRNNFHHQAPARAAPTPVRAMPIKQAAPATPRTCYNCGETGHISSGCTKPKKRKCFKCGLEGHFARECTRLEGGGQGNQQRLLPPAPARIFAIGQIGTGVEGTLSVYNYLPRVLFDTGASHSFISSSVVDVLDLTAMPLTRSLCVTSPLGVSLELDMFCDDCPIGICGREFFASLNVIPDHTYDVILGMDWLSPNHAVIDCFRMVVSFRVPG